MKLVFGETSVITDRGGTTFLLMLPFLGTLTAELGLLVRVKVGVLVWVRVRGNGNGWGLQ